MFTKKYNLGVKLDKFVSSDHFFFLISSLLLQNRITSSCNLILEDIKELNINPQAISLTLNFLPIHYNCRQAGKSHKRKKKHLSNGRELLSLEDTAFSYLTVGCSFKKKKMLQGNCTSFQRYLQAF